MRLESSIPAMRHARLMRYQRRTGADTVLAPKATAGLVVVLLLAAVTLLPGAAAAVCTQRSHYAGEYGAAAARNLTAFRTRLLGDMVAANFTAGFGLNGTAAWRHYDFASPFVTCPPAHTSGLLRYGRPGDGGKLLCDLAALTSPCLVYSLGSNGDYSFEQDILKKTPCEVHTFDCTFNGSSVDPRHYYHRICIGNPPADVEPSGAKPEDFRPFDGVVKWLGHEGVGIDVLKMDIEGHELAVLSTLRQDHHLPQQMVVEIHLHRGYDIPGYVLSPAAPRNTAQLGLLMSHLASVGYGIVAREDNDQTVDIGCCTELTFLRVEAPVPRRRRRAGWRGGRAGAAGGLAAGLFGGRRRRV